MGREHPASVPVTRPVSRDANTDLMRATGITLVLLHHLAPVFEPLPGTSMILLWMDRLGLYGVDMFFVLSGWLIGGLYWKERSRTQNVDMPRFWIRRWFRTLPPYFAAMIVFYAAVHFLDGAPFDWRYLFFLQNYDPRIPWFAASWSLCIEEHFYLGLPLVLLLLIRTRLPMIWLLLALTLISPLLRLTVDADVVTTAYDGTFGAPRTSTHLRFDGLAIGVLLAYLHRSGHAAWPILSRLSKILIWPLLAAVLTIPTWNSVATFYLGYALVNVFCGCMLLALATSAPLAVARWRLTYWVALWSYSIYLSHTMIIRGYVEVLTDRPALWLPTEAPLLIALCLVAGYFGYILIERPSMVLRDRYFPKHA